MNIILILCDTLRRDHCGPYHQGRPLNEVFSAAQPAWRVPTPNMQRLGEQGTVFTNAWCGSSPCMPARRDIYTGRLEFLERGWGPLEEDDLDLPRLVSGRPNRSIQLMTREGCRVSQLITDHFHLWEKGSGNYHMGFTGFDFVRGVEGDNYRTDPVTFKCPESEQLGAIERHWRNVHFIRKCEADYFAPQVFSKAADWLRANHQHQDFYLHLDCFDPHEPWDPPEEYVKMFDPRGYDVPFDWRSGAPYAPWPETMTEDEFNHLRARYAAEVVMVDRWLGKMFEAMDELDLWKNTMVILVADHGTYNGDHGRMGKMQTHLHDATGHIPFVVYHPEHGHGETRDHLVQLVDVFPTVLSAVGRPFPETPADRPLHGIDLLPVLADAKARTRDYAISGIFGRSVTITDGDWILHQSPTDKNQPLNWYGYCHAKFLKYELGPYEKGRRRVLEDPAYGVSTWLSDKRSDLNELVNLVDREPGKLQEMQDALRKVLRELKAPVELAARLGL